MRGHGHIIHPLRGEEAVVFTEHDREFEAELTDISELGIVIRLRPFEGIYPWQEAHFDWSSCYRLREGALTDFDLAELGRKALKQYKEPAEWTDRRMSDQGRAAAVEMWHKLHIELQTDWSIARWQSPVDGRTGYAHREGRQRVMRKYKDAFECDTAPLQYSESNIIVLVPVAKHAVVGVREHHTCFYWNSKLTYPTEIFYHPERDPAISAYHDDLFGDGLQGHRGSGIPRRAFIAVPAVSEREFNYIMRAAERCAGGLRNDTESALMLAQLAFLSKADPGNLLYRYKLNDAARSVANLVCQNADSELQVIWDNMRRAINGLDLAPPNEITKKEKKWLLDKLYREGFEGRELEATDKNKAAAIAEQEWLNSFTLRHRKEEAEREQRGINTRARSQDKAINAEQESFPNELPSETESEQRVAENLAALKARQRDRRKKLVDPKSGAKSNT